jgi:hypothetical protein
MSPTTCPKCGRPVEAVPGEPVIGFPIRHYGRRGPRTKTVVRSGGSRPRAAPLIRPSGRIRTPGIT